MEREQVENQSGIAPQVDAVLGLKNETHKNLEETPETYLSVIEKLQEALDTEKAKNVVLKKENEALKNENSKLQKTINHFQRFITTITHDTRALFSRIVQILELFKLDEEYMEKNAHMKKQVEDADEGLSEMREEFDERLELQKKPSFQRVNITDIVKNRLGTLKLLAEEKGIRIITSSSEAEISAITDPARIHTILHNLVSNAVKFTSPGKNISISIYRKNGGISIAVSDEGVGMTPDQVRNLFTKELATSQAGTANEKGFGFGLNICQEYAKEIGGTIKASSEGVGKGSTFTFHIPAEQFQLLEEESIEEKA